MTKFKVAHIRQQGIDLIIIPLDDSFDRKTESEQAELATYQFQIGWA